MQLDDPRHGKNAGYIAGCRDACCKTAHADYKRHRRTRVYLAKGLMTVDSTGTRRRVQALVALGHTMEGIDVALGHSRGYTHRAAGHPFVYRSTADKIATLYEAWSMIVPTGTYAERNRRHARTRGWLPPLAWDDIDDPHEKPGRLAAESRRWTVDEVVVERFLTGDHHLTLNVAERREVVRRWPGSHGQLERMTGWNVTRYIENREEGAA